MLSPISPMLATEVVPESREFHRLISDPAWVAQRKYDGIRVVIHVTGGKVITTTRNGNPLPGRDRWKWVWNALSAYAHKFEGIILDGEAMMDGNVVLFDVPCLPGAISASSPWRSRHAAITKIVETFGGSFVLPETSTTSDFAKSALWDRAVRENYEGIIFKRQDSTYRFGERSRSWVKAKSTATVEALVLSVDPTSCRLGLYDHSQDVVEVCGAKIQPGVSLSPGDVVTVRYLYASPSGRLVQPRIIEVRSELTAMDIDDLTNTRKASR